MVISSKILIAEFAVFFNQKLSLLEPTNFVPFGAGISS